MERLKAEPVLLFRPLTQADLPLLHEWLNRPHVAEWWSPMPTLAEVEEEFGPLLGHQSPTRPYIVLGDGTIARSGGRVVSAWSQRPGA